MSGNKEKKKKSTVRNSKGIGSFLKGLDMVYFLTKSADDPVDVRNKVMAFYGREISYPIEILSSLGFNINGLMEKRMGSKDIRVKFPKYIRLMIDEDTGHLCLTFSGERGARVEVDRSGVDINSYFRSIEVGTERGVLSEIDLQGMLVRIRKEDIVVVGTVEDIEIGLKGGSILEVVEVRNMKVHSERTSAEIGGIKLMFEGESPDSLEVTDAIFRHETGKARLKGTFKDIKAEKVQEYWQFTGVNGKANIGFEFGAFNPSFSIPVKSMIKDMVIGYLNSEVLPKNVMMEDKGINLEYIRRTIKESRSAEMYIIKRNF
ncbi:MAG TPA: hypothetical protein PLN69_11345 [bacterium]|nr:hypothetical protein [bacterium]